jgi:hypothetical protein
MRLFKNIYYIYIFEKMKAILSNPIIRFICTLMWFGVIAVISFYYGPYMLVAYFPFELFIPEGFPIDKLREFLLQIFYGEGKESLSQKPQSDVGDTNGEKVAETSTQSEEASKKDEEAKKDDLAERERLLKVYKFHEKLAQLPTKKRPPWENE